MATQQKLNDLQIRSSLSWGGLTTENHLSSIYAIEPMLVSDIVTRVHSKMNYDGFISFINKFPVKTHPTDIEYRWYLKGDDRRAINIVSYSAFGSSSHATPGIANEVFLLEVEENLFKESEFLTFDDSQYGVRIVNQGYANGTNWMYEVEHMKADKTYFIPPAQLAAGKKVRSRWAPTTNTMSDEGGGVQFTSHFMMEQGFSTLAKEYTVPGNMQDRPMLITAVLPNGEKTTVWTRWQEMMVDWAWEHEKATNLFLSESNKDITTGVYANKAKNGFVIKQAAGLREQISPSYKFYYTKFTLEFLEEVLYNLSVNILPEDQRKFTVATGERGMIQFHKAMEALAAIILPFGVENRITGSGQNLGIQGQYMQYKMRNGVEVTVVKMAEYDDLVNHGGMLHPDGGPVESYRMTIMNTGTAEGEANIQRVIPKGRGNMKVYLGGMVNPFGVAPLMSSAGSTMDGYKVRMQATQSIMIKNPLSCCELIYNGVTV